MIALKCAMSGGKTKPKTAWIRRISSGNGINLGNVTDAEWEVSITFKHSRSSVSETPFGVYANDNIFFRDGIIRDEKSSLQIIGPEDNTKQTLTFTRFNGTKSFSTTWGQSATAQATLTKENGWSLFSYYYVVYPFYGSISACDIKVDGQLVKSLRAAKDGERIGFFDSVSNTFIEVPKSIYAYEEE